MIQNQRQGFYLFLALGLSLLLMSCSTGLKTRSAPTPEQGLTPSQQQTADYQKSAAHYLNLAAESSPTQAMEYRLLAADMFAQAGVFHHAESLLDQINPTELSSDMQLRLACTQAQLMLSKGEPQAALDKLPLPHEIMQSSRDIQRRYLTLKALAHSRLNNESESVQTRLKLDELLLEPTQIRLNREAIWQGLNYLSDSTLIKLNQLTQSTNEHGWYELAIINKQYHTRPHSLSEQFSVWRQQYPTHPGNEFLPKHVGFTHVSELPSNPQRIALLLPMSGKLSGPANAIRDGFLASYYQTATQSAQPQIKIYDSATGHIHQLYEQAVNEGAEFIVGPLEKEAVLTLGQLSETQIRTPVLALNHHDGIRTPPSQFFQFSLSPENEARVVARKAFADGHRRAAILVPNNAWGERIATAFKSEWTNQDGQIIQVTKLPSTKDYSITVRDLLNIDESQKRANDINALIGEKAKFEPRRRQDIDVILMAASPEQARQLRPLFNFYYASDLPIYATSSVYSGKVDPAKDNDMNGLIFCDMPWILDKQHPVHSTREEIQANMAHTDGQYQRLYALGADAHILVEQLSRLTQYHRMGLPAATGTLYLGSNHRIERHLKCAKIEKGIPHPL